MVKAGLMRPSAKANRDPAPIPFAHDDTRDAARVTREQHTGEPVPVIAQDDVRPGQQGRGHDDDHPHRAGKHREKAAAGGLAPAQAAYQIFDDGDG